MLRGDWSAASGYEIGLSWPLDLNATALFVANDHMAFGLLSALRERGLSVPEELSVVGFDDIPEAEFMAPPLSTVRMDFFREGERRCTELIGQIESANPKSELADSVVELIHRRSIRPPADPAGQFPRL